MEEKYKVYSERYDKELVEILLNRKAEEGYKPIETYFSQNAHGIIENVIIIFELI